MGFRDYFNNLKTHQKAIAAIVGSVVILSLLLTLIQPFEYRSSIGLLVIQKQIQNLDAYAASRSAERLSKNLSKVIYTSSFFEKVMNSGFDLKDNFSKNEARKRRQWRKKITARVSRETGMLKIDVYDKDRAQAEEFARAVAYVLSTKGEEYHGGGKNVEIKLVDAPLTSRFPVRPNLALNLFTGLILGIVASGGYLMANSKFQILNSKQISNSKEENYELETRNQESTLRQIQGVRFKNEKLRVENRIGDRIFQTPRVLETRKIFTMYDHLNIVRSHQ
jgi:capsular polysaccharide biosynthesis protein